MNTWLLIVAMTLVTFAERFAMLEVANRVRLPMLLLRALRFVPAALLTAIAVPPLVTQGGQIAIVGNERVVAGLVAALVAWRTKNVVWTILAGMAVALGLAALKA